MLPTATWYEKNDLNTSDMHPFIHPLSAAVDLACRVAQRLGDLSRAFKKFSEVCVVATRRRRELVLTPPMHDSPGELAQALERRTGSVASVS